jgi:hypothetical protein
MPMKSFPNLQDNKYIGSVVKNLQEELDQEFLRKVQKVFKQIYQIHNGSITTKHNDGSSIFVFGSNQAGRHGKGAALDAATYWGAEYGVGEGRTGMAYAIPTKDKCLRTLSLSQIRRSVITFGNYANDHPELKFYLTEIGCGLAGYKKEQIAPLFKGYLATNVIIHEDWIPHLL